MHMLDLLGCVGFLFLTFSYFPSFTAVPSLSLSTLLSLSLLLLPHFFAPSINFSFFLNMLRLLPIHVAAFTYPRLVLIQHTGKSL